MLILALPLAALMMIRPPVHRVWTRVDASMVGVGNETVYVSGLNEVGALRLKTGEPVWMRRADGYNSGLVDGDKIFVLNSTPKTVSLLTYDLRTGQPGWTAKLPADTRSMAADKAHVFVMRPDGVLAALDSRSGKERWATKLAARPNPDASVIANLTLAGGKLFAGVAYDRLYCLVPQTGKILWSQAGKEGTDDMLIPTARGVITTFDQVRLLAYDSGKPLWTFSSTFYRPHTVIGNVLIGEDNGRLCGISTETGLRLWQDAEKPQWVTAGAGPFVLDPTDGKESLIYFQDKLSYIDKNGKRLWTGTGFFNGSAVYVGKDVILSEDGGRLLCYLPGALPKLPVDKAQRRALANKLVAHFEELDDTEWDRLSALAPDATGPLIKRFVAWAIQYDKLANVVGGGSLRYYGLLRKAGELLGRMCEKDDTPALLDAISKLGADSSNRDTLEGILASKGDRSRATSLFIADLERHIKDPSKSSDYQSALQAVAYSSDPAAVQFMIGALNDPKAPSDLRAQAFIHLPATGGEAGLAAVRALRPRRAERAPWQTLFQKYVSDRDVVSVKQDSGGKTWRLVRSAILGNVNDLYMQQKSGSGWSVPVFTGVYTGRTWKQPAPKDYRGIPIKQLLESDWIKVFPDDPGLTKDSDSDGLTDLAEARLGTDPNKADTDGDGLSDAVDPCPNAAPRELGDKEKIAAACVDARFFGEPWGVPAIIEVEGVPPFEMYGYDRQLFWKTADYTGTLPTVYDTGVNLITIADIKIQADGKSATADTIRYSGGLDGDTYSMSLRKFEDDWFVVDSHLSSVS